jgi:hypothetical protein
MHGGYIAVHYFNNLSRYSPESNNWMELLKDEQSPLEGRCEARTVTIRDPARFTTNVYVIGGVLWNDFRRDVFRFEHVDVRRRNAFWSLHFLLATGAADHLASLKIDISELFSPG